MMRSVNDWEPSFSYHHSQSLLDAESTSTSPSPSTSIVSTQTAEPVSVATTRSVND